MKGEADIHIYQTSPNKTQWIYYMEDPKIVGVTNGSDSVFERKMTINEELEFLGCAQTMLHERWRKILREKSLILKREEEDEVYIGIGAVREIKLMKVEDSNQRCTELFGRLVQCVKKLEEEAVKSPRKRPATQGTQITQEDESPKKKKTVYKPKSRQTKITYDDDDDDE